MWLGSRVDVEEIEIMIGTRCTAQSLVSLSIVETTHHVLRLFRRRGK
jgi:hypothetical protein